MASREEIEKVRQEIMRFRELLNISRARLDDAERAYAGLFSICSPEDKQTLKEKDLQWKAAEVLVEDVKPLAHAVGQARFNARELHRAFEELHDIVLTVPEP